MKPRRRTPAEVRLWKHVDRGSDDECWLWHGAQRLEYGIMSMGGGRGKIEGAHRVSWMAANGAIPDGMHVLHSCDVPLCVNPKHLFLGTNQDNIDDMVRKHRQTFGTRNAMAKLNDSDVVCIRERLACGETNRYISEIFSVSESLVSQIKNGRIWKHVA